MTGKTIFIDESGNFGKRGRYFTISGVVFDDEIKKTEIKRIRKVIGGAKKNNPDRVSKNGELKAKDMPLDERVKLLRELCKKQFSINYITLDLHHMYGYLSNDQNIFYNYLTKFIIQPILSSDSELDTLTIIFDLRNTSVKQSKNFGEYIKTLIWGEWGYMDVQVNVQYYESQNVIGLQCADYIANAIYGFYEHEDDLLVKNIRHRIQVRQTFPWKKFGK